MCNCKYDCCAVCSYNTCYGVCCSAPPPTCGCGEGLTSGETCLNTTYYVYSNKYTEYYFYFKFGYVIFIPVTGGPSLNTSLINFFQVYYSLSVTGYNDWKITKNIKDVPNYPKYTSCQNSAQNCFLWQTDIDNDYNNNKTDQPFTPYLISGCDSAYPSTFPCSTYP